MGLALVVVAVAVEVPVLLAVAVVAGVAQSMVLVMYITLRTAYSPDELLGRIGSTARTVSLGLQPIGLLIGGALIDATSGSTTIAVIGLGIALVSLAFVPVRALRRRDASRRADGGQAARATGAVTGSGASSTTIEQVAQANVVAARSRSRSRGRHGRRHTRGIRTRVSVFMVRHA